jgi:L-ascorbate metabolism protein UlaG (beta-lactamase superfamily)
MKVMDWMEQTSLKLKRGEYKITFVPACHWSRRWIADLNKRLWGGFVIETPFKQMIYYSGDTGYCEVFK